MVLNTRCLPVFVTVLFCLSCHSSTVVKTGDAYVRLSKDSQTVYIGGLDYAVLHDLKTDTLTTEGWQGLIAVYKMPADTDMQDLQTPQPGQYTVTDTSIVFKPDTPFAKHHTYFTRYFGGPLVKSEMQVVQKKAKLQGQRYSQTTFKF